MKSDSDPLLFARETHLPVIDGLRAIAIIPVVAFHVGIPMFSGGFVGVDIFFVISGFLISRLLLRELQTTGRIDVLNFYARRVRRLLPALAVVLVSILIAGYFWLTPAGEQQQLSSQTIAAAGFASNFYFWRTQAGYFAGPSDQLPLLHMWTLAVEEQFYIAWPLMLIVIGRVVRRERCFNAILATLIVATLLSFVACWVITTVRPTIAFYMIPFRAWEFGIGALLTFAPSWLRTTRLPAACSFVGAAAIAVSVVAFSPNTQFPGPSAALPVIGAAGIILGALSQNLVSRALVRSPMLTIGKWSYSWYLWHWPLLAISRSTALGEHDLLRDTILAGVALLLSAATYRWIDDPVRRQRPWPFSARGVTVVAGALSLVIVSALAVTDRLIADSQARNDPIIAAALAAQNDTVIFPDECTHFRLPFNGLAPAERCTIGEPGTTPLIMLWGDSHAHHFIPALANYVNQNHLRLLPRIMGGCPPVKLNETEVPHTREALSCLQFNSAVAESLPQIKAAGASMVILAARWFLSEFWSPSDTAAYLALAGTVSDIQRAGLRVVIFADVPRYSYSVPQCIVRRGAEDCSMPRTTADTSRRAVMNILYRVAADVPGVIVFDPIDGVCNKARCLTMRDGAVLYRDSHHISVSAARAMADAISHVLPP